MKKYVFEAKKNQREKPFRYPYIFVDTAKATVYAETEDEARTLAEKKLRGEYQGTGVLLCSMHLLRSDELPVDWSYGYACCKKSGCTQSIGDCVGNSRIR